MKINIHRIELVVKDFKKKTGINACHATKENLSYFEDILRNQDNYQMQLDMLDKIIIDSYIDFVSEYRSFSIGEFIKVRGKGLVKELKEEYANTSDYPKRFRIENMQVRANGQRVKITSPDQWMKLVKMLTDCNYHIIARTRILRDKEDTEYHDKKRILCRYA